MTARNRPMQEFKFRQGLGFGTAAAEQDSLLAECFFPTASYHVVRDIRSPRSGLIGRSGSGKTAILERLKLDGFRTVSINPDELAFQYLGSSDLIQTLRATGINLDYFYKLLWRHVFVVEILKHRFPEDARQTGRIGQLVERIQRNVRPNPARDRAIKYLDEWGARIIQGPQERVQQIHDTFEKQLRAKLGVNGPWRTIFGLDIGIEGEFTRKKVVEERVRNTQEIVSQIQVLDLNAVRDFIGTEIINDQQNPCFVLIDDLDKFWVEEPFLYELIRAMLLEIYEWARVPNVKIVYALRDNVLHKLESDFQSRSYQREKLADQHMHLQWNRHELTDLVDKRLAWLAGKSGSSDAPRLTSILPKRTNRRQSGLDYILDRTLNRPRDVIDFLNRASELAIGRGHFSWSTLERAEQSYSTSRLVALFDEWNDNYAGLDLVASKLLRGKKPRFRKANWDEDVLLDLFTDIDVDNRRWLKRQYAQFTEIYMEDSAKATHYFTSLFVSVMFEVGLVGVRTIPGGRDIYADVWTPILLPEEVSLDSEIIVRPMFYSALRIDHR